MKKIHGKNVLITGGAKGMGKAYVDKAIEENAANIIIWDIDETALNAIAKEYENAISNIHTFVVDVTNTSLIYEVADKVIQDIGAIHLLINNAGIVISEDFIEHSKEKIDLTMQINTIAPMHIARALLPAMVELDEAHIVNIASGAAYMYCPKIVSYCASKWAMYSWSQGLRVELEQSHPQIKVTTVIPGHIDTGMFDGAHSALMPAISAETMVAQVWRGIKKNKATVTCPKSLTTVPFLRGVLGTKGWDIFANITGINAFMSGSRPK